MKYLYTLLILALCNIANAQTSNASFELWEVLQNQFMVSGSFMGINFTIDEPVFNYNEPEDWSSTNQLTEAQSFSNVELVTLNSNAFDGLSSVQLESQEVSITVQTIAGPFPVTNVAPALIVSGEVNIVVQDLVDNLINGGSLDALNPFSFPKTGQPIDFQPGTLSGQYMYTGVNNDSAVVVSGLILDRELVGYAVSRLGNTTGASWEEFNLEYNYLSCDVPDTIITLICASNLDIELSNMGEFEITSNYTGEDGSLLIVDDLQLDTVNASTFPPLANNDFSTILNIETATEILTNNDDFCDGSSPDPTILTTPSNGTLSGLVAGSITYTPNLGFVGTEIIDYEVCTSPSACDTATWTITVTGIDPCVADDITRTIVTNTVELIDVANANCGGAPTILMGATSGVANVEANNQISYSPNTDFVGMDVFTYSICNVLDASQCDTGMVTINIIVSSIASLDKASYTVYPNPVKGNLHIEMIDELPTMVFLYNLDGRVVFSDVFEKSTSIETSALTSGQYIVKLVTDERVGMNKIQVTN